MAKKTILNEDAGIYQKREDTSERQKMSEMTSGQKWQYIKDYYLKKVLFGSLFLGFLVYIIYTIVAPHDESLLYATIINDNISTSQEEAIIQEFGELIDYNPNRQTIIFDDSFYLNPENVDLTTQSKIATYAYANSLDVIIADEDMFEYYVNEGYFFDLTQVLPSDTYSNLTDSLYMGASEINEDTTAKAYGVYLDNSKLYTDASANYQGIYGTEQKRMVIGIVQNTKNRDVCIEFIKYLFSKN